MGLAPHNFAASPLELVILVAVSTAFGLAFQWLHIPGNLVLGAMLGSGILHGGGFTHAILPWWAIGIGVVALGAITGSRFSNTPPRMLFAYLGAALGSFAVAAIVATLFALLVASLAPAGIADLVVAFSPGAQDTMMVLALSLNIDPVFVGAHQLARYMVVSLSLPVIGHLIMRRRHKPDEKKDDPPPGG
jgi:membrane AbrB-like protein